MNARGVALFNQILSLVAPVGAIVSWQLVVASGLVPSTIFPTPLSAARAFVRMALDGKLLVHAWASIARLATGFAIGTFLGLAAGVLVGMSQLVERILSPTLRFLAPIPPIAFIPVLIALFGIQDGSKVALIAVGSFFVIYSAAVSGIRGVDSGHVEVATLYHKPKVALLIDILAPSALTHVASSARIALGLSWILLIAAEVISSSSGLGWLIWDSRNFGRVDEMVAGMFTVGILGLSTDVAVQYFAQRAVPWRSDFSGA